MPEILVVERNAVELAGRIPGAMARSGPHEVGSEASGIEILLADPRSASALVDRLPRLRWIQSTWAGVDALVKHGVPDGVVVTGVKGVFGRQMAEFVFGHLLAHALRVPERTAARRWDDRPPDPLCGSRMGILGTGSIGTAVAETAVHFGLEVVGCNRVGGSVPGFGRIFPVDQKFEFADDLEYLVVVLPSTPATAGLVDIGMIDRMRRGSTLINVGRGDSVVIGDVVEALGSGHLAHAVLDVLPIEPLPDADPLWEVDGLVITSHTAAWSDPKDIARVFLDNLERFRAGSPLHGVIDLSRGY